MYEIERIAAANGHEAMRRNMLRHANRGEQNGRHLVRHDGVLRRVPTFTGPERKQTRYMPHQGKREMARRAKRAA